jgi:FemAB-related protein (PEP-CTERM system-associated)
MSNTYGYNCYFLQASIGSKIEGVLPLFFINSRITGRSLQSLPGAICTSTPEIGLRLIGEADALARELRADYLLLRDSRQPWSDSNIELIEDHRGVRLNLFDESEAAWNNLRKDVRYHIRNGRKKGNINISFNDESVIDFYSVLQKFSQQIGTPVFGENFIENILTHLGKRCQIVTAHYNNEPIAGLFNFILGNRIYGIWSCALSEFRSLKVTHRLYWALIEDACKRGYTQVDMGRSPYPSGHYKFKAQWGDQDYPIYQLFRIYRGKVSSMLHISTYQNKNSNMSLFSTIWKNLPSYLARTLGPSLRWHIPFG